MVAHPGLGSGLAFQNGGGPEARAGFLKAGAFLHGMSVFGGYGGVVISFFLSLIAPTTGPGELLDHSYLEQVMLRHLL